ncbi:MAG: hypothetical protein D6705_04085 [Deltaproteobacteria bacterium]|nr:MAG: hypothetical protein D6705_04085 [Deltaproteobacteria bacterium]
MRTLRACSFALLPWGLAACGPTVGVTGGGTDSETGTTGESTGATTMLDTSAGTDPCEGDPCCGAPCCAEAGRGGERCSPPIECVTDDECDAGEICAIEVCEPIPELPSCAGSPAWVEALDTSVDAPNDVIALSASPSGDTLAVATPGPIGIEVSVLAAGDLAPTGVAPEGIPNVEAPASLLFADIDGDGRLDVVLAVADADCTGIWLSLGTDGGFGPWQWSCANPFEALAPGPLLAVPHVDTSGADVLFLGDRIEHLALSESGTFLEQVASYGSHVPTFAALADPPDASPGDSVLHSNDVEADLRSIVRASGAGLFEDGPSVTFPGRRSGRRVVGRPLDGAAAVAWTMRFDPPPGQDGPTLFETRIAVRTFGRDGKAAAVGLPVSSDYERGILALPGATGDLVVWGTDGIAGVTGLSDADPTDACFYAVYGGPFADAVAVDAGGGAADDVVALGTDGRLHLFLRQNP